MVNLRISKAEPALIIEGQKRYMVITDLHIGFESEFASNKIEIGKNSSINETINRIKKLNKRIDDISDSINLQLDKNKSYLLEEINNKHKEKCIEFSYQLQNHCHYEVIYHLHLQILLRNI